MRLPNWQELLFTSLEQDDKRTFAYGTWDCCLFAAEKVQIITGIDHAAQLRGYNSKIAAYRIIERHGSLEAMISALLGRSPVPVARAMRGDVVLGDIPLIEGETGESVGICLGVRSAFPKNVGLRMVPTLKLRLCWRIE